MRLGLSPLTMVTPSEQASLGDAAMGFYSEWALEQLLPDLHHHLHYPAPLPLTNDDAAIQVLMGETQRMLDADGSPRHTPTPRVPFRGCGSVRDARVRRSRTTCVSLGTLSHWNLSAVNLRVFHMTFWYSSCAGLHSRSWSRGKYSARIGIGRKEPPWWRNTCQLMEFGLPRFWR